MVEIRTEKETVQGMIAENKNQLMILQIQVKWLSSQVLVARSNRNPMELQLSQTKKVLKEKEKFIEWLEGYLKVLG